VWTKKVLCEATLFELRSETPVYVWKIRNTLEMHSSTHYENIHILRTPAEHIRNTLGTR